MSANDSAESMTRYSITRNAVLVDTEPEGEGKNALIWDAQAKRWSESVGLTTGQINDSIPVREEEAVHFCQTGEMPYRVKHAIETDTGYCPDPWDD